MAKMTSLRSRRLKLADTDARDWRAHEAKIRGLYERENELCRRISKMDAESGHKSAATEDEPSAREKTDWTAYGRAMPEGEMLSIPSDIAEPIVDRLMESGGEFRIQPLKGRVLVLKVSDNH